MDGSAFLMTAPNVWTWGGVISTFELLLCVCICVCVCPGAEHASITVKTNVQVAQTQVEEAQKLSVDADKKLTEAKVMEVQRMAQHAASSQSDEEDIPEAYLREDWSPEVSGEQSE